jgi:hypothetical protein
MCNDCKERPELIVNFAPNYSECSTFVKYVGRDENSQLSSHRDKYVETIVKENTWLQ